MKNYTQHTTNKVRTPQSEKVPGVKKQVRNSAGGVSFKITKWEYMLRFLILGTEGGTYYVGERKLTKDAAKNVEACIAKNGTKAVDLIVEVSTEGRAANNDAAIFALALAASCDDKATRKYALQAMPKVCRIGTHLFHFIIFVKTMRGFGRGLREGIAQWYTSKTADQLAYQMLKYKQRDGWSHRDVLRMCHAHPLTKEQNKLFAYAVGKRETIPKVSDYAIGARKMIDVKRPGDGAKLIRKYNLTREVISTNLLNEVCIWEALLEKMPMTALIRNLGKMASLGMHTPFKRDSDALELTVAKLTNAIAIQKSRVHPITIMNALKVYQQGQGMKGSLSWEPNNNIINALEDAFYMAFDAIEPTGKRIMLALDVSGSMGWDGIGGLHMNCREASAILAMATMRTEQNTFIAGFTGAGSNPMRKNTGGYGGSAISLLPISHDQKLDDVVLRISGLPFGTTDCALPFLYLINKNIDVDAVIVYTDNETWAGNIHPWQALRQYEAHVGHSVKSVVVAMTGTQFSIAKPDMPNMLDVVGFDSNTPAAISNFIR